YTGLTGNRFALYCAETLAIKSGFKTTPVDNFLVFHIAFGKTVNDISLNAVANLGYAEVQFNQACFDGDTLTVKSEVIGLKENSNGKNGVVYVRSVATNQNNQIVVSWIRWVMVEKQVANQPTTQATLPKFQAFIPGEELSFSTNYNFDNWKPTDSDNQIKYDDLQVGDYLFHRDGMTINDSDHSLATRLYQNNARVHFDQHLMQTSQKGKRLVYGGHIISICRALSYNGFSNAIWPLAINAGTHANPSFAGDTIFCQSEVIAKHQPENRSDIGFVRVRMLGIKNDTPDNMEFLYDDSAGRTKYHSNLVLDLDYWCVFLN
ncbi:MAG: MaoC family dehydratase, partial [Kangiellaceae bacterium]|nr:MaoC family dehydratase [Kangiellaceae bacterium]